MLGASWLVKSGRDAMVQSGREAGVLSDKEADMLLDVRERVMEIIAVDDFELEELQAGLSEKGESIREAA